MVGWCTFVFVFRENNALLLGTSKPKSVTKEANRECHCAQQMKPDNVENLNDSAW